MSLPLAGIRVLDLSRLLPGGFCSLLLSGRSSVTARMRAPTAGSRSARTRDEWTGFGTEVDCCLEPVLTVDEALASAHVAAHEMIVEIEQPGATTPVRLLGPPVKLSRTPADPARLPGPELRQHTDEVLRGAVFAEERIAVLRAAGAIA